jgi:uncharacterized protein YbjT (DUF2867 family)
MTSTDTTTVAVTGSTGFVGREITRRLLAGGYRVRALVRDRAKAKDVLPVADDRLTLVQGDALDGETPARLVEGAAACIHLIGIIREEDGATFVRSHVRTTEAMLAACSRAGCLRFVQMSALGVSHDGISEYQRTKWDAEVLVRASGLDWTIFRPGLIHGRDSSFIDLAVGWARGESQPWFFMPYFTRRVEDPSCPVGPAPEFDPVVAPVAVQDVAEAFFKAIAAPTTIGEIYNLVGPESISWPDMLRFVRDRVPATKPSIHPWGVPGDLAALGAKAAKFAGLGWVLPFDEGMARMGMQDSVASMDKVSADLGLSFQPFSASFARYAGSLT